MKEIKLNLGELKLLGDLRSQVEQAQGEIQRKEAAFLGFIYGLCAAKSIVADEYDLTQIQIRDGVMMLMPKEVPVTQSSKTARGRGPTKVN